MVNVDNSRNYYQDLGVAPDADVEEIRKRFRRLAFQFHPDRNRGHEADVIPRFQVVQAAWEVLGDKATREKYDIDRKRYRPQVPSQQQNRAPNTPRARPPPPPRDFYSTPGGGTYNRAPPTRPPPSPSTKWPPPPSRPGGPNAARAPPSGTGPKPFNRPPPGPPPYPRPAGPPPNAHAPNAHAGGHAKKDQDKAAREKVFEAWNNMKGGPAAASKGANDQARPSVPNPLNNPNGVPFGRSQSTRIPKKGFNPATAGGDEGQAPSANYGRPLSGSQRHEDPLRRFSQQVNEPDVPFSEANRVRTPYSSAAGQRTTMFGEGVDRSSSVRNSPTHRPSSTENGGSYSDSGTRRGPPKKFMPDYEYASSSVSSDEEVEMGRAPFGKTQSTPQQPRNPPYSTARKNVPRATPINKPNTTPNNPFKSRSEEGINMKFSPSDWHGKFEGKADYFVPNTSTTSKDRTSPVRGRPPIRTPTDSFTAQRGQSAAQMPPPPPRPGPPPMNPEATFGSTTEPAPHATEFSESKWTETFKEPSFSFSLQPQPGVVETPRRPSAPTTRVKAVPLSRKTSTVPGSHPKSTTAATATEDNEGSEARPKFQAFADEERSADPDAMDIDSQGPVPPPPSSPKRSAEGTVDGEFGSPKKTDTTSKVFKGEGLNLGGFENVEPFIPSANGLSGLNDIGDTLPFLSQPSTLHPTKPLVPQELMLPELPAVPSIPTTFEPISIKVFFDCIQIFLAKYRLLNKMAIDHFRAREEQLLDLDEGWLTNRGEKTRKIGFASYLIWAEEDKAVHKQWDAARALHAVAMSRAREVRLKMLKKNEYVSL